MRVVIDRHQRFETTLSSHLLPPPICVFCEVGSASGDGVGIEVTPPFTPCAAGSRPKLLGRPRATTKDAVDALRRSPDASMQLGVGAMLPLSALLEAVAPCVDVESDRLTESIAWLYDAVHTLEERSSIIASHMGRLEATLATTLQQWSGSGVGLDDGIGAPLPSDAEDDSTRGPLVPPTPAHLRTLPGDSPVEQRLWHLEKEFRRMARQQDQKRIAEEKLLSMRIDSLKCEIAGRPSPNDFEGLKVHLSHKLDHVERRTREDVSLLGGLLNEEGAADRRRMLGQFEAFQRRQDSEFQVAQARLKDMLDNALQPLQNSQEAGWRDVVETRLAALEERCRSALLTTPGMRPAQRSRINTAMSSPSGDGGDVPELTTLAMPSTGRVPELSVPDAFEPTLDLEELLRRVLQLEVRVYGMSPATSHSGVSPAPSRKGTSPAPGGSPMMRAVTTLETLDEGVAVVGLTGPQLSPAGAAGAPLLATAGFGGSSGDPLGSGPFGLTVEGFAAGATFAVCRPGSPLDAASAGASGGCSPFQGAGLPLVFQHSLAQVQQQLDELGARLQHLEGDGQVYQSQDASIVGSRGGGGGGSRAVSEAASAAGTASREQAGAGDGGSVVGGGGGAGEAKACGEGDEASEAAEGFEVQGTPSSATSITAMSSRKSSPCHSQSEKVAKKERSSGKAGGKAGRQDLEERVEELSQMLEDMKRHDTHSQRSHADNLSRVRRSMELLAKFVMGSGDNSDGSPTNSDPLMRLEKNRHNLAGSLEQRLKELEGCAESGGTVTQRVKKVEAVVNAMDVEYLQQVKPELHQFRENQEAFQTDLHREVQEIKMLVGCLEACIPKETRKAVQLFKRAAGAQEDMRPKTPIHMQLEGKILVLQDQIETRLKFAEEVIAGQCDRVSMVVHELQRKQDQFDSHLATVTEKVGGTWIASPRAQVTSSFTDTPSMRSNRTNLQTPQAKGLMRVEWTDLTQRGGGSSDPSPVVAARRPSFDVAPETRLSPRSREAILEKAGATGWKPRNTSGQQF